jgi:hypothetical protein
MTAGTVCVEKALAGARVPRLNIVHADGTASTLGRFGLRLLIVNVSNNGRQIVFGHSGECGHRHFGIDAAAAHNRSYQVTANVARYKFGARQVRTAGTPTGIEPVAKRTLRAELPTAGLDEFRRE